MQFTTTQTNTWPEQLVEKKSMEIIKTTPVGFEPTRGDPIGLAGRRLSRSAKVSMLPRQAVALCGWSAWKVSVEGGLARACPKQGRAQRRSLVGLFLLDWPRSRLLAPGFRAASFRLGPLFSVSVVVALCNEALRLLFRCLSASCS